MTLRFSCYSDFQKINSWSLFKHDAIVRVMNDITTENSKRQALHAVARNDHSLLSPPLVFPTTLVGNDDIYCSVLNTSSLP